MVNLLRVGYNISAFFERVTLAKDAGSALSVHNTNNRFTTYF